MLDEAKQSISCDPAIMLSFNHRGGRITGLMGLFFPIFPHLPNHSYNNATLKHIHQSVCQIYNNGNSKTPKKSFICLPMLKDNRSGTDVCPIGFPYKNVYNAVMSIILFAYCSDYNIFALIHDTQMFLSDITSV